MLKNIIAEVAEIKNLLFQFLSQLLDVYPNY